MKLASHNSMSFAKPRHWWLWPFRFMARCQSKNLQEQYAKGVRYFDLRIAFKQDGTPMFAHGSMSFAYDVYQALDELESLGPCWVRLINERDKDYVRFITFCIKVSVHYKNLAFVAGRNKKNWSVLYEFTLPEPKLMDKYASNNVQGVTKWKGLLRAKNWSGTLLDDLWPRYYAKKHNVENRDKYLNSDEADFLMQDFIGVY